MSRIGPPSFSIALLRSAWPRWDGRLAGEDASEIPQQDGRGSPRFLAVLARSLWHNSWRIETLTNYSIGAALYFFLDVGPGVLRCAWFLLSCIGWCLTLPLSFLWGVIRLGFYTPYYFLVLLGHFAMPPFWLCCAVVEVACTYPLFFMSIIVICRVWPSSVAFSSRSQSKPKNGERKQMQRVQRKSQQSEAESKHLLRKSQQSKYCAKTAGKAANSNQRIGRR